MLLVPMSLGYYHKKEEGKKKRKLGRSFQHVVGGGGGWRAAAPDLEKVIVIHDPVRYPVAGAWTVAIVPFRFVTPRPRACAKVQKRLRGSELHNIPRIQAHTHKAGLHHLFFFVFPAADVQPSWTRTNEQRRRSGCPWPSSTLDSSTPQKKNLDSSRTTPALYLPCMCCPRSGPPRLQRVIQA